MSNSAIGTIYGSDLYNHRNYQSNMMRQRDALARNEYQITSGLKTDKWSDLANEGSLEYTMRLESQLTQISSYTSNNNEAIDRLNAADTAIERLQNIAMDFKSALTQRNSAAGKDIRISQIGKNALSAIRDNLNSEYVGRYIFSGSFIKDIPVGDISNNSNISQSGLTANYYLGDNIEPTVIVSQTLEVSYGVTANEEAFQNLIGAIHYTIEADPNSDPILMEKANNALDAAINGMVEIRAKLGNNLASIESVNEQFDKTSRASTEVLNNIVNTDIVSTMTEMETNKAVLQATFMILSKTSSMSLINFID